jgi:hypothetical protein
LARFPGAKNRFRIIARFRLDFIIRAQDREYTTITKVNLADCKVDFHCDEPIPPYESTTPLVCKSQTDMAKILRALRQ